jgi:hypothetical protein
MRIADDIKLDVILVDLHMVKAMPTELRQRLPLENCRFLAMSLATGRETQVLAENLGAAQALRAPRFGGS